MHAGERDRCPGIRSKTPIRGLRVQLPRVMPLKHGGRRRQGAGNHSSPDWIGSYPFFARRRWPLKLEILFVKTEAFVRKNYPKDLEWSKHQVSVEPLEEIDKATFLREYAYVIIVQDSDKAWLKNTGLISTKPTMNSIQHWYHSLENRQKKAR